MITFILHICSLGGTEINLFKYHNNKYYVVRGFRGPQKTKHSHSIYVDNYIIF